MGYLIVNTGKIDGNVCVGGKWQVMKPGQRLVESASPSAWTKYIRVIKQDGDIPVSAVKGSGKKKDFYGETGVPVSAIGGGSEGVSNG